MIGDLEKRFRGYLNEVVPKDAGLHQRRETRRAFYAGAASLFRLVRRYAEGDETEGTEALDALADELDRFQNDLKEGMA